MIHEQQHFLPRAKAHISNGQIPSSHNDRINILEKQMSAENFKFS